LDVSKGGVHSLLFVCFEFASREISVRLCIAAKFVKNVLLMTLCRC